MIRNTVSLRNYPIRPPLFVSSLTVVVLRKLCSDTERLVDSILIVNGFSPPISFSAAFALYSPLVYFPNSPVLLWELIV